MRGVTLTATLALALAGCQTSQTTAPVAATDEAHDVSAALASAMQRCWFASDAAFSGYVYAPEVVAGNPRILILPKTAPDGRPALVVEAKTRAVVEVYGPLLGSAAGPRIRTDIERWKSGNAACA